MKILCVAEKPSISKAVAGHLSGGGFQTVSYPPLLILGLSIDKTLDSTTRVTNTSRTTPLTSILDSHGAVAVSP